MVLMFTSGHMYNHIRKVPYITGNQRGGITYFAGGFSNQFGIETQIIAAICKLSSPTYISRLVLMHSRCCTFFCDHFTWIESSENERCSNTADSSYNLGIGYLWHVQLPHEPVQNQEWRISVLVASFLRWQTFIVEIRAGRVEEALCATKDRKAGLICHVQHLQPKLTAFCLLVSFRLHEIKQWTIQPRF